LPLNDFAAKGSGNGTPSRLKQFNPFLDDFAQFRINLGLIAAMHAAKREFGATANEALILVAPLGKFA